MKVSTLENKAKELLNSRKEEIVLAQLVRYENQIAEMESALVVLKQKKVEFMEADIESVQLHEFTY
jgi:hypothetical protein